MSMSRWVVKEFNSTANLTIPAGITQVLVYGMGGGASGVGGINGTAGAGGLGGAGGVGQRLQPAYITVTPNTTYTITVGAGGTTGASNGGQNAGADSSFGALMVWKGAPTRASLGAFGPFWYNYIDTSIAPDPFNAYACGGSGGLNSATTTNGGYPSRDGIVAVGASGISSTAGGAGGGGMGGEGQGGVGGVPVVNANGGNGGSAAANSGAGGGGGAGGGATTKTGGTGGAGGSGKVIVMWVE